MNSPILLMATEMPEDQRYCTCCERKLKHTVRMLELDQRIDAYHDFNDVPANKSQGWFPFGLSCAKHKIRESLGKRS